MEFTVYRQAFKVRPDGTVVYKGEDARPYVSDRMIMTADGLGGASSIRHTLIKPELFIEEKLPETLFDGVYDDYSETEFSEYVRDSFFELFAVRDCYTDNINNIKKSGYFASRIVSAIVMHEIEYNEIFQPDCFFSVIEQAEQDDIEDLQRDMDELGDYFAEKIKSDMLKIAENANLVYESRYEGLALLGTTLCACIYRETDEYAQGVFLTAGDSRPYVWDSENGLCQIVADEERPDGGMTNYIRANGEEYFRIYCCYKKFKKPCVIFGATDGCFDSAYFNSNMSFEKLILDTALASENTQEMGGRLSEFFTEYGRHDDSSTMAFRFFGYTDFADFKSHAEKRLAFLEREYISMIPELLTRDFSEEFERFKKGGDGISKITADILRENSEVKDYCERMCRDIVSDTIENDREHILLSVDYVKAEKELKKFVVENFSFFIPIMKSAGYSIPDELSKESNNICKIREAYHRAVENYYYQLELCGEKIESAYKWVTEQIGKIKNKPVPDTGDVSGYVDGGKLDEIRTGAEESFSALKTISEGTNDSVKMMGSKKSSYIDKNKNLSEKYPDIFEKAVTETACGQLVLGDFPIEDNGVAEQTVLLYKKMTAVEERIRNSVCKKYIDENIVRIVGEKPEELSELIEKTAASVEEEFRSYKEKSELQRNIFAEYDLTYSRYFGGSDET